MKPTIIIMAAGIGSRYGGLKQTAPVGPSGEIIMEYSIFDALEAGFSKIVFVIKKDMEKDFREKIGRKIEHKVDVSYVFQGLNNFTKGFEIPSSREKPWGTGHAVLSCKDVVKTPFSVINADDFYGKTTFSLLSEHLNNDDNEKYSMVGFLLKNTVTDNGSVARGICEISNDDYLLNISEKTHIEKYDRGIRYVENNEAFSLDESTTVSMNAWGFPNSFLDILEEEFPLFLEKNITDIKSEFYLPAVVDKLIKTQKQKVKVLAGKERWYGVTYKEDMLSIQSFLKDLHSKNIYPKNLFN